MSVRPTIGLIAASACLAAGLTTSTGAVPSYAASAGRLPTHVNSCWSSDNGAPVLDSFTTTTQSVDVTDGPATVGITMHAHDVGGPGPAHALSDRLKLQVYEPDARDTDNSHVEKISLARTQPGTWTGSWTVPHNAPAAPIRFNWLLLKPSEGPVTSLQYDQLGPDATIQVTSAHPDTTPPAITDFGITPNPVDLSDGSGRVQVNATVQDDTGVSDVSVHVGKRWVNLRPGSTPDQYTRVFTIRPWEPRETLPLEVAAADLSGVSTTTTSVELVAAGLPSSLTVLGSHRDRRAPRLDGLHLSSHHLRLRPDGWLTVRVHAADPGTGIGSMSLRGLVRPSSGTVVLPSLPNHPLHRIAGTRRHGVWGARVHVLCVPAHSLSHVRILADDRAGNRGASRSQTLWITGPDRVAPTGDDLDGGGVGKATVTFSEPVRGISTAGVLVSEHGGPPYLTGSWSVSPRQYVTSATFTATDPDALIEHMDFAPEGHLDVLDRAGNPLLLESDAD